jgi:tRNA A-37 threonylcarbamoyl transferase component Bud32
MGHNTNEAMTTLVGIQLSGRYRLDAQIGSGGMSTVYRATDTVLERHVAVKLMHREIARDSDQLERFRREARAVAQLSHAHIVNVIDAGEDAGHPYIVFEHVDGETLKERIRRMGRLPVDQSVAYAIEIARALRYAHSRGIVHRDIKPQNVLIGPEGSAKVTDFGIARTLDDEGLTAAGRVLGTTDYVSPEQALGHSVTGQTDIYSLGVVLYEMLVGDVPFQGESQVAVAMRHVREDFPDVRERRPEISVSVARVLDRMTSKDLATRYPDVATAIRELEETLALEAARSGHSTGEATSVLRTLPAPTRRRLPLRLRWHPPVVLTLLAGLLALAAMGVGAKELIERTERGTGAGNIEETPGNRIVSVRRTSASAYDPLGDGQEHDDEAARAVDREPDTVWSTETYRDRRLANARGPKDGVGLYVDAQPGVEAVSLTVQSPTPGWQAEIYAAESIPDGIEAGQSLADAGWERLAAGTVSEPEQRFELDTGGTDYRYYLVWITELPPGEEVVEIDEVALEQRETGA